MSDTASTAAIFNGSGPVPLGRRLGSEAYQQLMASWKAGEQHEYREDLILQELIVTELNSSRAEARRLGTADLRIGTITYPAWFKAHQTPSYILWNAAQIVEPLYLNIDLPFDSYIRLRTAYVAALWTWPASGCLETLLDGSADPIETMVMLFEQSANKIRIMISWLDSQMHELEFDTTISWPATTETIRHVLAQGFETVSPAEISGVLFSGDHPAVDFAGITDLLQWEYPDLARRIREPPLGLEYTYAVGAACYARQLAAFPESLDATDTFYLIDDELL